MKRKIFLIPLVLLLAAVIGCSIYLGDYYRAEAEALALADGMEGDGVPAITAEEQIAITAEAIAEMVGG